MRVTGSGELAVVACLHGDEEFGKIVIDNIEADEDLASKTVTILANEAARDANRRFIDTDLNRSFRKEDISGNEANLAPRILEATENVNHLFDIHTTYSANFKALQIVALLSSSVQLLLSHFDEQDVVLIAEKDTRHSLIGNHRSGVSLEFGREYAKEVEPLKLCLDAVRGVVKGGYGKYRTKRVFEIDRLISSAEEALPQGFKNGEYSESHGGYVIMPKPVSMSDYQGFLAKNMYNLDIKEEKL